MCPLLNDEPGQTVSCGGAETTDLQRQLWITLMTAQISQFISTDALLFFIDLEHNALMQSEKP